VVDAETGSADYRRATTECLAFGAWLRRFAEAELEEPETGE
jgi:CRISPR-associated protein Cmr5